MSYKNSSEHIFDELNRLDIMLNLQLSKFSTSQNLFDNKFRGIIITPQEISTLLKKGNKNTHNQKSLSDVASLEKQLTRIEAKISKKVSATIKQGTYLSLHRLSQLFYLTKFEEGVILMCLAPEINKKYEKLYAYLNDDITKKTPTINLILETLCKTQEDKIMARTLLSANSKLFKYGILHTIIQEQEKDSHLSKTIKLKQIVVDFLLQIKTSDPVIDSFTKILDPKFIVGEITDESKITKIRNVLQHNQKLVLNFFGPNGCGKKSTACVLCNKWNMSMRVIDLEEVIAKKNPIKGILHKTILESILSSHALYFDNFDVLIDDNEKKEILLEILSAINEFPVMVFFSTNLSWSGNFEKSQVLNIEFSKPDYPQRKKIWELLKEKAIFDFDVQFDKDIDFTVFSSKFGFTIKEISNALIYAKNLAAVRVPNNTITIQDLNQACKSTSNQNLAKITKKIEPNYSWEDIVLPHSTLSLLKDICNHVQNKSRIFGDWGFEKKYSIGKGLAVLFKGEPGTGKTMAAEVISKDLALDLYKIDLSTLVSKYIGETEKNLNKIFSEAETSNAILFFDEADALFGKRSEVKDVHDRYANVETNYLLQKIEEYDGICILATNFQKNIDAVFMRRMHYVVEFPIPNGKDRYKIWQDAFPKEAQVEKDLDFKFLSENFRLSGASITNIVISAAFMAVKNSDKITMKYLINSIKQDYQKIGKPISKEEFGKYSKFF